MLKLKHIAYLLPFIICPSIVKAQYAEDGLKFSQQFLSGTSRYLSIGGAQTSLGGDLGSLGGNPAGVGMFRKSELGLSFQYLNNNAKSAYLANPQQQSSIDNFKLSNISLAFPLYINKDRINEICNELVGFTVGIGYNKTNDFYTDHDFGGRNPNNSITQSYSDRASNLGVPNENLPDNLGFAYDNYLIDEDFVDPNTGKIVYVPISTGNVDQRLQNTYKGYQSETNIVASLNYGNKLYFGASLKFGNQRYDMDNFFKESGINSIFQDPSTSVTMMNEIQNQKVDGSGFTGKLGAIFRPLDEVRLGGSVEFPSSWKMEENYIYDQNSTTVNGTYYEPNSPSSSFFNYTLTTPYKYNLGAAYFIGKKAFISADVEFIDFSKMKFRSSDSKTDQNFKEDVNAFYRSAVNFHIGGEVKFDELSARAGFATYGNPFTENSINDGSRNFYTAGLGYRINNFYVDAAYIYSTYNTTVRPYLLNDFSEPVLNVKNNSNTISISAGFRF